MKDIECLLIGPNHTIEDVIKIIQKGAVGIALVVDEKRRLIVTVTDGDLRRAVLNKISLGEKVSLLFKYIIHSKANPVVAPVGTSQSQLLQLMKEKVLRQIPLLDVEGRVIELALLSELIPNGSYFSNATAVIMAGGKGERLYPLTKDTPKPMLTINGVPLIKRIIEQLRDAGIRKVRISTHYKSEVITNYFKKGEDLAVDIDYLNEHQPLGTAGALSLSEVPEGTTLIINGDILTQVDFQAMYVFHTSHQAMMTVALRRYEFEVPYGVVQTNDIIIERIVEKPRQEFLVNAGIYLIEPLVYQYIPKGKRFDMTDLINRLLKAKHKVISFPVQEYWLDVGMHSDYKQAVEDVTSGRI